jgi:hypothetical protein
MFVGEEKPVADWEKRDSNCHRVISGCDRFETRAKKIDFASFNDIKRLPLDKVRAEDIENVTPRSLDRKAGDEASQPLPTSASEGCSWTTRICFPTSIEPGL